jgi:hypothetical protein
MFLVVNTFTVIDTIKGRIIVKTITIPTKLIVPNLLINFFIIFILKVSNASRVELEPSL